MIMGFFLPDNRRARRVGDSKRRDRAVELRVRDRSGSDRRFERPPLLSEGALTRVAVLEAPVEVALSERRDELSPVRAAEPLDGDTAALAEDVEPKEGTPLLPRREEMRARGAMALPSERERDM